MTVDVGRHLDNNEDIFIHWRVVYKCFGYKLHIFFLQELPLSLSFFFFFFNDPPPTEISPLPLHDPLPILSSRSQPATMCRLSTRSVFRPKTAACCPTERTPWIFFAERRPMLIASCAERNRSEEHTSELQSQSNLVCRLLLEKKKKLTTAHIEITFVLLLSIADEPLLQPVHRLTRYPSVPRHSARVVLNVSATSFTFACTRTT